VTTFKAYRIHESSGKISAGFEDLTLDALTPGEVVIDVQFSDINYKDALAATGAGKILRRYPLVGGIDLAGVVRSSDDARFQRGDPVLVTGCGLSESFDGGYSEVARVLGDSVIPMPEGLDAFGAMALGTAGFTAALAIHRMERNGQSPGRGPVVVTGATGGVGSLAIDMLAGRGYEVVAVSGKPESFEYLKSLGAASVVPRGDFQLGARPLEPTRYAGARSISGGISQAWDSPVARSSRPPCCRSSCAA
jgi:acrylyl-CoA reductase (NADPH)